MSIIKWRTRSGRTEIVPIEVERESEQCVWIKGRRNSKITGWECFHDTWDAARQRLLDGAEAKLQAARQALQRAQDYHGNVKGLKRPADA